MARCAECGLLQIMDRRSRVYVAVEPKLRQDGEIPKYWDKMGQQNVYEQNLACMAIQPHLADSMAPPDGVRMWPQRFIEALNKEHDCQAFQRFQPGLSPEKHREIKLLDEMQRLADKHRREEEGRMRAWRDEDRAWQKTVEAGIERRFDQQESNANSRQAAENAFSGMNAIATLIAGGAGAGIVTGILWLLGKI
jgi:hypothetical protein